MNRLHHGLGWGRSLLARLVSSPGEGEAGQHVPEPRPELRGKEGVQDRVDAGVAVGQNVGPDLEIQILMMYNLYR